MKHLLFLLWILSMAILSLGIKLKTWYEWKFIDFVWKSPEHKQLARESGNYIVNACVLYDVDKSPEDGRVFVTAVRDKGVPASLMTVTNEMGEGGPLLHPYPNWSWYENNKCNSSIIAVYRVYIICNHLFVLDCGKVGEKEICPAKLLIFNLFDDKLIRQVIIPDDIAANKNGTGLLVTPMVLSHTRDCTNIAYNATVYMADILGYGLVVWDASNSEFYRFESDYMKPTNTTFTIEKQSFSLDDGILGLTLNNKDLYYASLAGNNIYRINTRILRKCRSANEINVLTQLAVKLTGQTAPIASKDSAIFFSNIPQTSIMCADASKKNNSNTTVIAHDAEKLQFPSGMKVISTSLIILTNRFQRVATNTLNLNEINFRVLSINLEEVRRKHIYKNCFASYN